VRGAVAALAACPGVLLGGPPDMSVPQLCRYVLRSSLLLRWFTCYTATPAKAWGQYKAKGAAQQCCPTDVAA